MSLEFAGTGNLLCVAAAGARSGRSQQLLRSSSMPSQRVGMHATGKKCILLARSFPFGQFHAACDHDHMARHPTQIRLAAMRARPLFSKLGGSMRGLQCF